MSGTVVFSLLVASIFLSMPIAFGILALTIGLYTYGGDIPLVIVAQNMYFNLKSYAYSSVLYFVFAGYVMCRGELSKRLLDVADAFFGWLPGGFAISAVVACALFGSITGSDLATLAAMGGIIVPALVQRGWSKDFAVGLAGSSALLGMIIPPSIPVIIYALFVNVSVGGLFLAGVLPGLLIVLFFSIYIGFKSRGVPGAQAKRPSGRAMLKSIREGAWALGLPVVIFGGIYSGVFTVTEAAAVAALYAVFVEMLVYRDLKLHELPGLFTKSAVVTATLLMLVGAASVLAGYLTMEQIPQAVAKSIFKVVEGKFEFLWVTNLFLLLVGCLLDLVSATMILMPVLQPLYKAYGIDDIHFGMIFLLNLYLGFLTPPVGINLFAAASLFGMDVMKVAKAYVPFFLILLVVLALVVIFPGLSTWLPALLLK
jgi:C4-dicarboxylate transporter DctM subunit